MIRQDEIFPIGKITKLHGISGVVELAFTDDVFDRAESPYLVLEMDGLFVPFFWEEYRFKGQSSAIFKFEDIETEQEAQKIKGINVYYPACFAPKNEQPSSWKYFTGFAVHDTADNVLGTIEDVDDSSENILLTVRRPDGSEMLLPLHPDFVTGSDAQKRILTMDLPEGLTELN